VPCTASASAYNPRDGNNNAISLDPGAPLAASGGASDGVFTWTPTDAGADTANPITISATDDGSPVLASLQSFTVVVVGRPLIENITISNNLPVVDWTAFSNQSYRLQFMAELENHIWSDVVGDVIAAGPTASQTDPDWVITNRYYCVRVVPRLD